MLSTRSVLGLARKEHLIKDKHTACSGGLDISKEHSPISFDPVGVLPYPWRRVQLYPLRVANTERQRLGGF